MDIIKRAINKSNIYTYKPKNRSKQERNVWLPIVLILGIIIISAISFFFYKVNQPNSQDSKFIKFDVKNGESVKQVSQNLKNQNLIQSEFYFNSYIYFKFASKKIRSGNYEINTKMSIADIANIISGHELSKEGKIIIIEGWNSNEIADYIADFHAQYATTRNVSFDEVKENYKQKFSAEVKNASNYDYGFLADKPKEASLEGYLYPDTYFIYRDSTPEQIIKKMLDNFNKKVTKETRDQAKNKNMSLFEALTLASIVQKEVKTPEEMRNVAGVYFNRLAADKALESDSTITYITGENKTRASKKDLKIKSPYNTYLHKGLPPGPIGNPSLTAITAVLNPIESNYLFFITDNSGKAIFSETGEEHIKKVEKHLNQ